MLLQIREVSSESLNIQTVGRIKRNPIKGLQYNDITNKYYIYSNYQEGKRKLASYKLKKKYHNLKLFKGNIFLNDESKHLIENKYNEDLIKFFSSSAIKDLVTENQSKTSLPLEERTYRNKNATRNSYFIEATSIFKLKIWIDEEIKNNEKYFTNGLYEIVHKLKKELEINQEIIKYTILKEYLSNIKSIFSNSYNLHRENERYKLIPNQNLTKNYQMWIPENEFNQFDVTNIENYGYTLIKSINSSNKKDIQFLDSNPETIFMSKILEEIEEEEYSSNIKFFSKMPTLTSNIFFEYLKTEDSEKHKAFIDFALVSEDKVLMIEVKGWNDYDEGKTNDLLHAFSKYKEQNSKYKLDLLVCYSGKDYGVTKKPKIQFLKNGEVHGITIRKALKLFFN